MEVALDDPTPYGFQRLWKVLCSISGVLGYEEGTSHLERQK